MNKEQIWEDLEFFLPDNFQGLSKKWIIDCCKNKKIQQKWTPKVGDLIVGPTGNIFIINGEHNKEYFFFYGNLCNRDGGNLMTKTYSSFFYTGKGESIVDEYNLSKKEDFFWVPWPHLMDKL